MPERKVKNGPTESARRSPQPKNPPQVNQFFKERRHIPLPLV